MERSKFLTIIIITLLVLNLGTLAYLFTRGQRPSGPPLRQEGGPSAFIIEKLKFDEKQEKGFITLRNFHRDNMRQKQDSLRILKDDYFKGLETDTPNMAKAAEIETIILQKQKEMDELTFDHFARVRQLCSPQQKKLFDEFIGDILRSMGGPKPPKHEPPPR